MDTPDPVTCDLVRHLITIVQFLLSELQARHPEVLNACISGWTPLPPPSRPPTVDCPQGRHDLVSAGAVRHAKGPHTIQLHHRAQCRGPKIWRGRKDLSATVRSTWTQERIHLTAEVVADVHCPPPSIPQIDQGDSFQFALTPEETDMRERRAAHNMYEYILGLVDDRPICIRSTAPIGEPTGIVPNPDLSIRRNRNRTIYRIAIPWSDIPALNPEPGRTYRFALAVNERDNLRQSRAWMEWSPGLVVERDPACFGTLRLIREKS